MKVLFLTNIPSPYMVDFFNEFGKLCDLTVVFERSNSSERDESWKKYNFSHFKGIILKGINIGVDGAFCPNILKFLQKDEYDFTIIANPMTPTGIISILYLKLLKRKYIIESEGGFAKDGKGLKERFKKLIIKDAFAYFSTTAIGDNYFITYGADKNRIFKYPFSSIFEKDILHNPISYEEKLKIREELHIHYKYVILSVGRTIYSKGFDILLNELSDLDDNYGIYIIGGKLTDEIRKDIKVINSNVHFINHVSKSDLDQYYLSSDIFVLMTRSESWGLVINEAMSKGLPVITTNMCIAGTELIENDVNGRIVKMDDTSVLYDSVKNLIEKPILNTKIPLNNLNKIKWYTVENMAEIHLTLLEGLIKNEQT